MLLRAVARFDGKTRARPLAWPRETLFAGALIFIASAGCLPSDFDALTERDDDQVGACGDASLDAAEKCGPDADVPEDAAIFDAMADDGDMSEAGLGEEAGMVDSGRPPMCSGECQPGTEETDSQPCGACGTGTQMRKRTCSSESCTWSSWMNVGACTGVTAPCAVGDTSACDNGDSCGQRVCVEGCKWSACQPKKAGSCLRIRQGHTDEGSNYQCCGVGHWQFCMPDCTWSTECKPCSAGEPNFCSDCYP